MASKKNAESGGKAEPIAASGPSPEDLELQTAETGALERKVAATGTFYTHKDNIIQVSEPQVRLALQSLAQNLSREGIGLPLGIFLSLLAALVAADFKSDLLGIPDSAWRVLFIALTVLSGIWFVTTAFLRLIRGSKKNAIERCIEEIKGGDDGVAIVPPPPGKPSS